MARRTAKDPKVAALRAQRSLNPHPEAVTDEAFTAWEFLDARDLVQVKYEMVRRVRVEGDQVRRSAAAFGFSRPSFYQAAAALDAGGLPALVPARPGPRRAHKLTPEIVAFVEEQLAAGPALRPRDLVEAINQRFGVVVHPRSVERALARSRNPKSGGRWPGRRGAGPGTGRPVRGAASARPGRPTRWAPARPGGAAAPRDGRLDPRVAQHRCGRRASAFGAVHTGNSRPAGGSAGLDGVGLHTRRVSGERGYRGKPEGHRRAPGPHRLPVCPPVDPAAGAGQHRVGHPPVRPAPAGVALGWAAEQVVVIDCDQGHSGASAADREGFQRLVAEVGMGRAGIVLGLEVSRLARNNADWHRLLELCSLSGTLILDEDGLYDPCDFNDRLLLGLKGTMSEAELHFIRARLRGGQLSKARRGELVIPLPVGLVYDPAERVVLDPDTGVQQATRQLFAAFARTGSARAVVKAFNEEGCGSRRGCAPVPARASWPGCRCGTGGCCAPRTTPAMPGRSSTAATADTPARTAPRP